MTSLRLVEGPPGTRQAPMPDRPVDSNGRCSTPGVGWDRGCAPGRNRSRGRWDWIRGSPAWLQMRKMLGDGRRSAEGMVPVYDGARAAIDNRYASVV